MGVGVRARLADPLAELKELKHKRYTFHLKFVKIGA
jgi:hypothetical protein